MTIPFRPTPLQGSQLPSANTLMQSLIQSKQRRILKAERERAEARQAELDKQRVEQQAFQNEQAMQLAERQKEASERAKEQHSALMDASKFKQQEVEREAKQRDFELDGEKQYGDFVQNFETKRSEAALNLAGKRADVLAKLKDKGVSDPEIKKTLDMMNLPDVEGIQTPRPSAEAGGVRVPLMTRAERIKRLREESSTHPTVMGAMIRSQAPRPSDQRSFSPKKVTYNGEEILANYDAKTGRYYDVDSGAPLSGVSGPPTADMKNKKAGREMAMTAIKVVERLSKEVIEDTGIQQRIQSAGRNIEAVFGNDPVYRTYMDSKMALAGNLAVAQQGSRPSDADIQAIWVPLVPDPYRDTKESTDLKWFLIKQMTSPDTTMDVDAAWNELFGQTSPGTTNDLGNEAMSISSAEDYNALNDGQLYIDPDTGEQKRKGQR